MEGAVTRVPYHEFMIRKTLLTAAVNATIACTAAAAEPTLTMLGMLELPDTVAGPDGAAVPLMGLSGITWLGDDTWAAVLDNNDRLVTFAIELTADGKPVRIDRITMKTIATRHDYEDIAPCPPTLEQRIARKLESRGQPAPGRCVLLCDEDTPAIRGLSIADGRLLGAVPLPEVAKKCRPNKGLESLAVEPDGRFIWTANEEALSPDGPQSARRSGTMIRLMAIPTPRDDTDQAAGADPHLAARQFAYQVDPPHEMVSMSDAMPLSGVAAIAALGGGRLLVLERSGGTGLPPFENRIYLVDTTGGEDVSTVESMIAAKPKPISKRLLWKDSLGCNVEGLAIGPEVKGGHAVVGIADNGHIGGKTPLAFFHYAPP